MIGDHADAQRVAALLGSHLGCLELRDDVRLTTDRDGVRVELYRRDADTGPDVLNAVADFIHDNGWQGTTTPEFVTGVVADVAVTANVSPRLALLAPTYRGIA